MQNAKLLFGGRRHEVLPLLRQDGQVGNAPLDELFIVDIGRGKFHQMTNAPAHQIAVSLKVAVFAAVYAKDFCIGHSDRWLFCHDQFCDKNPSNLFRIAICTAANAALKSDRFDVLLVRGFVLVRHIGRNLKIALVLGVICIRVKGFFFCLFLLHLLAIEIEATARSQ